MVAAATARVDVAWHESCAALDTTPHGEITEDDR